MTRRRWLGLVSSGPQSWCRRSLLAAESLTPLDVRKVKVGGEMGRRIEVTVANNLLALNADTAIFSRRSANENRKKATSAWGS